MVIISKCKVAVLISQSNVIKANLIKGNIVYLMDFLVLGHKCSGLSSHNVRQKNRRRVLNFVGNGSERKKTLFRDCNEDFFADWTWLSQDTLAEDSGKTQT